jgi:hypothetical protein
MIPAIEALVNSSNEAFGGRLNIDRPVVDRTNENFSAISSQSPRSGTILFFVDRRSRSGTRARRVRQSAGPPH